MISILIQESEAYDRLTVLEIKLQEAKDNNSPELVQKLLDQIEDLEREINRAIGYDFAKQINYSKECEKLYDTNKNIFYAIDELTRLSKLDLLSDEQMHKLAELGIAINNRNYERFLAKKALQEKFFAGKIEEIKIGYEQ